MYRERENVEMIKINEIKNRDSKNIVIEFDGEKNELNKFGNFLEDKNIFSFNILIFFYKKTYNDSRGDSYEKFKKNFDFIYFYMFLFHFVHLHGMYKCIPLTKHQQR